MYLSSVLDHIDHNLVLRSPGTIRVLIEEKGRNHPSPSSLKMNLHFIYGIAIIQDRAIGSERIAIREPGVFDRNSQLKGDSLWDLLKQVSVHWAAF